jgi:L-asparagine transporter-like permease
MRVGAVCSAFAVGCRWSRMAQLFSLGRFRFMSSNTQPETQTPSQRAIVFASLACFGCFILIKFCAMSDYWIFDGYAQWLIVVGFPIFASSLILYFSRVHRELVFFLRVLWIFMISGLIFIGVLITFAIPLLVIGLLTKNGAPNIGLY